MSYLRACVSEEDLRLATLWFTGEALPRRSGRRTLQIGGASIKRALLSVPGIKPERYREISATQNDLARTSRVILQEVPLEPRPFTLTGLHDLLKRWQRQMDRWKRSSFSQHACMSLHPAESETVVKLLTGDLRIGLKEGLVEEAVAKAFELPEADVRQANMLTGNLGTTAVLAKAGKLEEAELTPFVPIRCMLAAPLERDEENDTLLYGRLPFEPPFWLEPKYDGIRAQLHKFGGDVGLFSRDLRPLDAEFPELVEAAKSLAGDFILDGELIAYAEGRKLGFADLQKRLGRRRVEGDLFMEAAGGEAAIPLKFVAFDLLWKDGTNYLNSQLIARRQGLEEMHLSGMFGTIALMKAGQLAEMEACFKSAIQSGHEGLIAKDPESVYSPGRRGKSWIKLKGVMPTLDCVVVFAEQGHGKRADVLSDYTFAVRDEATDALRVIGKAYSGLTDEEIEDLTEHFKQHTVSKERRKHKVEPNIVLEIAFDGIRRSPRHDSGLALRFPRIKAIRRDKSVDEIDTLRSAEALLKP